LPSPASSCAAAPRDPSAAAGAAVRDLRHPSSSAPTSRAATGAICKGTSPVSAAAGLALAAAVCCFSAGAGVPIVCAAAPTRSPMKLPLDGARGMMGASGAGGGDNVGGGDVGGGGGSGKGVGGGGGGGSGEGARRRNALTSTGLLVDVDALRHDLDARDRVRVVARGRRDVVVEEVPDRRVPAKVNLLWRTRRRRRRRDALAVLLAVVDLDSVALQLCPRDCRAKVAALRDERRREKLPDGGHAAEPTRHRL